jgi:diguanylate cyclase (GGDEF)-like protein
MKKTKPINVQKMFYVPLIVFFIITAILGLITYNFIANRFKEEMISSGSALAETLSVGISDKIEHKKFYLATLDSTLISAGNYIIKNRDLISNEYLHQIAESFVLTDIYWYNSDGLLLNDANDEFVGWTPVIGDPIYTFMHSGLDMYIEDIRRGTEDDRHYKFVYIRDIDGYFVQVGINADHIHELTQKFEYQYVLEQFVANNSELLYALIVDKNFISIADTDIDEIGVDYSGDESYEKVLQGHTVSSNWYYEKLGDEVLEISTPIYYNGEIIGIFGIGYSYQNYNIIRIFLFSTFSVLILSIMSIFAVIQYVRVVKPLNQFSKKIETISIENTIEIKDEKDYGVLSGLNGIFTDLLSNFIKKRDENRKIIHEMTELAFVDQLTKLPNRNACIQLLTDLCVNGNQLSVIYLDIDDFKSINDTRGHTFGDVLIQRIADRFIQIQTKDTLVFRHQGDEFLIVYKFTDDEKIQYLIEETKKMFSKPIKIDESSLYINFSIGLARYPLDGKSVEQLLHYADLAMYEAKKEERMSYVIFNDEISKRSIRKNEVLTKLKDAISNDGFYILYQPQMDIQKNEVIGLEALLRLKDSNISPYEFIPIAEQNRLINNIGRIVIEKVIKQQRIWKDLGIKIVPTHVNFSAIQLQDMKIIDYIQKLLEEYDIQPEMFGVEITESTIIDKRELTIDTLMRMKSVGIKTAIDDFGSGQAGINYMSDFKVDIVKFDKSFSDRYLNQENIEIFLTILKFTSDLGFITLAEGIETKEQVDLLKDTSCKLVQGYYYYKPQQSQVIVEILSKNSK